MLLPLVHSQEHIVLISDLHSFTYLTPPHPTSDQAAQTYVKSSKSVEAQQETTAASQEGQTEPDQPEPKQQKEESEDRDGPEPERAESPLDECPVSDTGEGAETLQNGKMGAQPHNVIM